MYFDEDGDLAHEFYEQRVIKKKKGRRRVVMCKCSDNLIPQVIFKIIRTSFFFAKPLSWEVTCKN